MIYFWIEGSFFTLNIGRYTPNAAKFVVNEGVIHKEYVLPVYSNQLPCFDEFGDLKAGYAMEAIGHDFANEGDEKIVISISDPKTHTYVWVFGVTPDYVNGGPEPFQLELFAEGKGHVTLQGNTLSFSDGQLFRARFSLDFMVPSFCSKISAISLIDKSSMYSVRE
nr:hypothetical protein [Brevibacillus marinus]